MNGDFMEDTIECAGEINKDKVGIWIEYASIRKIEFECNYILGNFDQPGKMS